MGLPEHLPRWCACALLAACATAADAAEPPRRIVSLNICTDELVLRLAPPERIASVTWLSRDPRNSNVAALAARVGVNHGLAEEIVPQNPDLILAGTYTTRTAVALLKQLRVPVTEFGIARSFAEVRQQIREAARLVGEPARGEALIADIDARLAAIPPATGPRLRAAVLNPNGATVGRDTLVDEIITAAGLENVGARLGLENYGALPLETVVASGVDILIVSASRDGPPALATGMLRHPVIEKLGERIKVVGMPSRLWNCGGPESVEAIAFLRQAADDVRRARATQ